MIFEFILYFIYGIILVSTIIMGLQCIRSFIKESIIYKKHDISIDEKSPYEEEMKRNIAGFSFFLALAIVFGIRLFG